MHSPPCCNRRANVLSLGITRNWSQRVAGSCETYILKGIRLLEVVSSESVCAPLGFAIKKRFTFASLFQSACGWTDGVIVETSNSFASEWMFLKTVPTLSDKIFMIQRLMVDDIRPRKSGHAIVSGIVYMNKLRDVQCVFQLLSSKKSTNKCFYYYSVNFCNILAHNGEEFV
jgi:hypothetical protein